MSVAAETITAPSRVDALAVLAEVDSYVAECVQAFRDSVAVASGGFDSEESEQAVADDAALLANLRSARLALSELLAADRELDAATLARDSATAATVFHDAQRRIARALARRASALHGCGGGA